MLLPPLRIFIPWDISMIAWNIQKFLLRSVLIINIRHYIGLVRSVSDIATKRTPIYHNVHLRLTKELQNGLSLSFYINNVANYRPTIIINGSERRMNEDISFGATATFKFGKL